MASGGVGAQSLDVVLGDLRVFVANADSQLRSILGLMGWSKDAVGAATKGCHVDALDDVCSSDGLVSCPCNPRHRMPSHALSAHVRHCEARSSGLDPDKVVRPPYTPAFFYENAPSVVHVASSLQSLGKSRYHAVNPPSPCTLLSSMPEAMRKRFEPIPAIDSSGVRSNNPDENADVAEKTGRDDVPDMKMMTRCVPCWQGAEGDEGGHVAGRDSRHVAGRDSHHVAKRVSSTELWMIQREVASWTTLPESISDRLLEAAKHTACTKKAAISDWILKHAPRHRVVLDAELANQIALLVLCCVESVAGELSSTDLMIETPKAQRSLTKQELLAEERDYKRRRVSYRGKSTKQTPTEVLRDVIDTHMEYLRVGGSGSGSELSVLLSTDREATDMASNKAMSSGTGSVTTPCRAAEGRDSGEQRESAREHRGSRRGDGPNWRQSDDWGSERRSDDCLYEEGAEGRRQEQRRSSSRYHLDDERSHGHSRGYSSSRTEGGSRDRVTGDHKYRQRERDTDERGREWPSGTRRSERE
ncbi:hypothetical protein CBR_g8884 [Chara braunii]|uniref:CHHC U11-48K-type domain-containing protein n=1 Tax=Chara braunii TaxID=69332 RepID=A0A388KN50_CHABU|nr:hypothetical protein CBR_g8884 [Chara braunii]|eukprot:GBG71467.1 hypothetical protein CBR_g8884 [Chara braunii]